MYPDGCRKIQPSNAIRIPTHYIHIIQYCHHIMAPHSVRHHKFDNIAYNIIPFVYADCVDYCFLTTSSRYLNRNIM